MNHQEALHVLVERLEDFQSYSYVELKTWIKNEHVEAEEKLANSGTRYELEFSVVWADQARGIVRIKGQVDDGQWKHPLRAEKLIQVDPTADWGLPQKDDF